MNREQLFNILRPIILTVTGVPECILADPNEHSPRGEYASVEPMLSIGQRGQAHIVTTNTELVPSPIGNVHNVNTEIRAQLFVRVSINFYRGDARNRASKLLQANKRPDISAILFKAGIGWNGAESINDLTALQSNAREQRAQVTLKLSYQTSDHVIENAIYNTSLTVENEKGVELLNVHV